MLTISNEQVRGACVVLRGRVPVLSIHRGAAQIYDGATLENDCVAGFVHSFTYPDGYGAEQCGLEEHPSMVRPFYYAYVNNGWFPSEPSEYPRPIALQTPKGTTAVALDDGVRPVTYKGKDYLTLLFNLIPRRTYTYKAMNAAGEVLAQGEFKTTGQVRQIALYGAWNARDLGGWRTNDGRSIAYGKVIRGTYFDYLNAACDDGAILRDICGVTAELDTRSASKEYTGSKIGVTYYGTQYNASKKITADKYGISSYVDLMKTPTNLLNCIKAILAEIEAGGCVYTHCKHGTDRTGTLCFILLGLCGATEDAMIKDFEMTSFWSWLRTKKIDAEDFDDFKQGEMRSVCKYLWTNYGGAQGATLAEQVQLWFRTKVCASLSDLGASYIARLQNAMVV